MAEPLRRVIIDPFILLDGLKESPATVEHEVLQAILYNCSYRVVALTDLEEVYRRELRASFQLVTTQLQRGIHKGKQQRLSTSYPLPEAITQLGVPHARFLEAGLRLRPDMIVFRIRQWQDIIEPVQAHTSVQLIHQDDFIPLTGFAGSRQPS